jgi:hypothetical protein
MRMEADTDNHTQGADKGAQPTRTTACPKCNVGSNGGRFCRGCGAELAPNVRSATAESMLSSAWSAPPQPTNPPRSDPPIQPTVPPPWTTPAQQIAPPPWTTPSQQIAPSPWTTPSQPPRHRDSSALAVALATAILVVVLAIAATVILLVASGDPNHTGVVTQSTVTNAVGESERPTP